MEIVLNDYHKNVNAIKMAKLAYWKTHPLSRNESLKRLRILREQRLVYTKRTAFYGKFQTYYAI